MAYEIKHPKDQTLTELLKTRQDLYRLRHDFKYHKSVMNAHEPGSYEESRKILDEQLAYLNKYIRAARATH